MVTEPTQRRLAAILSADAAGYSRLMGADDAATVATRKLHRHLLGTRVAAAPGAAALYLRGRSSTATWRAGAGPAGRRLHRE